MKYVAQKNSSKNKCSVRCFLYEMKYLEQWMPGKSLETSRERA
ncbi:hypothetical protein CLONEX_02607 [[Clostridium] nexile DSM 1787]|nr:hypothetical protein CLONEX_02607 [[Clostridium] nexile DSM 1787]